MARPKGSKNKARTVKASVDYAAVVAEKTAEKEKIESEVATLTANLDDLKTQLKAKKAVVSEKYLSALQEGILMDSVSKNTG